MNTYDPYEVVEEMDRGNARLVHVTRGAIYRTEKLDEADSLALAIAFVHCEDLSKLVDDYSLVTINGCAANYKSNDMLLDTLEAAKWITEDGQLSPRYEKLLLPNEKIGPSPANLKIGDAELGIARRKPVARGGLVPQAIEILEKTEFVVDEWVLGMLPRIDGELTKPYNYVMVGAALLFNEGNVPVHSEFHADWRGRLNQSDQHGPNGQSSDLARALMELHGVSMDYSVKKAVRFIKEEMEDMISIPLDDAMALVRSYGKYSKALNSLLSMNLRSKKELKRSLHSGIKKPWSFVKAARLLGQLKDGKKPYIGMAFGYDAKCSGPQIGALLTGDAKIAAACGFNDGKEQYDDAYEIAIQHCEEAGVYGFERASIKKIYMEVFYGQGAMRLTAPTAFRNDGSVEKKGYSVSHDYAVDVLNIIKTIKVDVDEDELLEQAEVLVKAIEKSFGRMRGLRNIIKEAHQYKDDSGDIHPRTNSATAYRAPDGFEITTKHWVEKTVEGFVVDYDVEPSDVTIQIGNIGSVFKKLTFKTNELDLLVYGRTGFVNFIQGGDAFLARLIIKKLDNLKVKHIIAIHDCFRVSITDMCNGKLIQAIQKAYDDFLTSGDAIGKYFDGVKRAGSDFQACPKSGVTEVGVFAPHIYKELDYEGLVKLLGEGATFFAK